MNILEAIFLGIVQGLTEFLPVSSSGHLTVFQKILGISEGALTFDVFLHFGTLIAVLIYYRKMILEILKNPFSKLTGLLLLAAIPAGVVGVVLNDFFDKIFASGSIVGIAFFITAFVLFLADKAPKGLKKEKEMGVKDALYIGFWQCLAILPGVSRSGMTISAALLRGLDKEFAAAFSFLVSIILIAGANLLEVSDALSSGLGGISITSFILGFIAAVVSGYLAISFMVDTLKKRTLKPFIIYVLILGSLILIDQLFFNIFFGPIF